MSLRKRFSLKLQEGLMHALGLVCVPLGLSMTLKGEKFLALLLSIVTGGVIGEMLQLEERLERFSQKLEERLRAERNTFAPGFLAATLLFCIGPMTIMGSLEDGLGKVPHILYTKSLLDGTASIAMAASLGVGVPFSALSILLIQGSITLLARFLAPLLSPVLIQEMTATGGILVLGIALNLLKLKKIRVANLLPSLGLIPLFIRIF
ncbi:MAG: DUF554 domain-containing protein [Candidatus Caldatribacterium sp.]|uniref:DUF554 domain-containing protein n=1 Tax=Candidatus Caldatribacterium sp. TaxID=2282143 RepID=UPI00299AD4FC|nr:DUF554 domain-containing protein [Candidatus Caldatribacterium sp.]MCX7730519.1 DUF554 domain-containing protein [Candidatus Caldatribacterium sp.]MDW8081831.1 DUF554 domain-containing protein [Candidatus Calescibacterium sp.]